MTAEPKEVSPDQPIELKTIPNPIPDPIPLDSGSTKEDKQPLINQPVVASIWRRAWNRIWNAVKTFVSNHRWGFAIAGLILLAALLTAPLFPAVATAAGIAGLITLTIQTGLVGGALVAAAGAVALFCRKGLAKPLSGLETLLAVAFTLTAGAFWAVYAGVVLIPAALSLIWVMRGLEIAASVTLTAFGMLRVLSGNVVPSKTASTAKSAEVKKAATGPEVAEQPTDELDQLKIINQQLSIDNQNLQSDIENAHSMMDSVNVPGKDSKNAPLPFTARLKTFESYLDEIFRFMDGHSVPREQHSEQLTFMQRVTKLFGWYDTALNSHNQMKEASKIINEGLSQEQMKRPFQDRIHMAMDRAANQAVKPKLVEIETLTKSVNDLTIEVDSLKQQLNTSTIVKQSPSDTVSSKDTNNNNANLSGNAHSIINTGFGNTSPQQPTTGKDFNPFG